QEPEGGAQAGYFYGRSGEPLYRIGPDDTLGSIAQRHLGRSSRWTELYEYNRDVVKNPENLTVGTVIRLPPHASPLSLVPEAERRRESLHVLPLRNGACARGPDVACGNGPGKEKPRAKARRQPATLPPGRAGKRVPGRARAGRTVGRAFATCR